MLWYRGTNTFEVIRMEVLDEVATRGVMRRDVMLTNKKCGIERDARALGVMRRRSEHIHRLGEYCYTSVNVVRASRSQQHSCGAIVRRRIIERLSHRFDRRMRFDSHHITLRDTEWRTRRHDRCSETVYEPHRDCRESTDAQYTKRLKLPLISRLSE